LSASDNKPDLDSLNLSTPAPNTGNGAAGGGGFSSDFKLPAEDQIRYRGVQQEIPHFGAPPKRTESLYMKAGEPQQASFKALGPSAMQRKKSLPDVAALPTVTVKQGSQAMTREEISVLSSARREEIRRQLDEAERYRANPIMYIFNPHIREWFSRQQLMMVVLFVNVTLAIMFFKLLT
jgi:junctophilin